MDTELKYDMNRVLMSGKIASEPKLITTNHELRLLKFYLGVQRLSGAIDTIPVVVPQESTDLDLTEGMFITLNGSFRSHNNTSDEGPRLILQVFSRDVKEASPDTYENEIMLTGCLCKAPILRTTPAERQISDIILAVKRTQRSRDYLPIIAWGKLAQETAQLGVGDPLRLSGRIQSRMYNKRLENGEVEERVAYEVSMMKRIQ